MNITEQLQHALNAQAWEDFADAVAEVDTADVTLLPALYACFTDEAAALPVMWQLLHLVEDFEEEASLLALMEQTPSLQEHAPHWLATLWSRTLNSDEARTRLQHEILPLHDFPDVQAYLLSEPTLQAQARQLF
jgi:hypothetical protein